MLPTMGTCLRMPSFQSASSLSRRRSSWACSIPFTTRSDNVASSCIWWMTIRMQLQTFRKKKQRTFSLSLLKFGKILANLYLYELKNTNSWFFEKNPANLLVQLSSGSDDEGEKFFDVGVRRHHAEPDANTAVTFLGKKYQWSISKKVNKSLLVILCCGRFLSKSWRLLR